MEIEKEAQSDKAESFYIKSRVNKGNRKAAFKLARIAILILCFDAYLWISDGKVAWLFIVSILMSVVAVALYFETGSAYITPHLYRSKQGNRVVFEQSLHNWQVLRVKRETEFKNFPQRLWGKPSYLTSLSFSMRHKNPPFDDVLIKEIYFKDNEDPEQVVKMIKAIQGATGFDVVFNDEALAYWYPTYQKLYGDLEYKFADYKTLMLA